MLGLFVAAAFSMAATPAPHSVPVEDSITVSDGNPLPLRTWPESGPQQGIVLALHGFTDYSGAFSRICPWLAARGYRCHAIDQRGFGAAPAREHWPGAETLASDVVDVIGAVRDRSSDKGQPLFLLGESMGGSVALLATSRLPEHALPAGLILAAPGVREELPLRPLWDVLLWTAGRIFPGVTVPVHREADPLLLDEANDRLLNDPLVQRRVRADTYYGVTRLADAAGEAAAEVTLPVLLLYGEEDGLIHRRSICAAKADLRGPVELQIYEGGPHLILHWRQQSRVLEDIGRWLDAGGQSPIASGACRE